MEGPIDWVTVKSTLPIRPFPTNASREPVLTPRLLIRPVAMEDLHVIHALRLQEEVMQWTSAGRIDNDLAETESKIAIFLPPNDVTTFNCVIYVRETEEFVGIGGCHMFTGEMGWPVIGYMFMKEQWGKGYASEFVKAFLQMWWALPREVCEVRVDRATARVIGKTEEGEDLVEELYTAVTVPDNGGSQRVLAKAGFEKLRVWEWEEPDPKDPTGQTITKETCLLYGATKPKDPSGTI